MEEVNDILKARRRFFISKQSQLALNNSFNDLTMSEYNSKVDLRPKSMIKEEIERYGNKPHVDAVLQPENRNLPVARSLSDITPDQLKQVKLRKVSESERNDRSGLSSNKSMTSRMSSPTLTETKSQEIAKEWNTTITQMQERVPIPFIPPPPPFPNNLEKRDQMISNVKRKEECNQSEPFMTQLRQSKEYIPNEHIKYGVQDFLEDKVKNMEDELERKNEMNQFLSDYITTEFQRKMKEMSSKSTPEYQTIRNDTNEPIVEQMSFNERKLKRKGMQNWINDLTNDRFERVSQIDYDEPRRPRRNGTFLEKERSTSGKRRNSSKVKKKNSYESFRSYKTSASKTSLNSIKSTAKSIKSVLFRKTDEEDLRSEISDDDIANVNAGDTSFVDFTYNKFTLHGPFVDKELNVFHSICREYDQAARFTFAKRNPFARTNSAYERVYSLIGSDRRSRWTNRDVWPKVTNDLQILDFIFRNIIRSRSRTIKEPVMEIEHFTEGSILDSRRFRSIMRAIFKKRDHLMSVLNIEMTKFEDIR